MLYSLTFWVMHFYVNALAKKAWIQKNWLTKVHITCKWRLELEPNFLWLHSLSFLCTTFLTHGHIAYLFTCFHTAFNNTYSLLLLTWESQWFSCYICKIDLGVRSMSESKSLLWCLEQQLCANSTILLYLVVTSILISTRVSSSLCLKYLEPESTTNIWNTTC